MEVVVSLKYFKINDIKGWLFNENSLNKTIDVTVIYFDKLFQLLEIYWNRWSTVIDTSESIIKLIAKIPIIFITSIDFDKVICDK